MRAMMEFSERVLNKEKPDFNEIVQEKLKQIEKEHRFTSE